MPTPVVVAYGRTPCCRARKGGLADMHPIDYAAQALKGVIAKVPYIQEHPEEIGDVITGCAMGAAVEFALTLAEALKGESTANELRAAILY